MGALTSNRKRGEDYFTLNHYKSPILYSPDFDRRFDSHVSKKQKLSSSMHLSPERLLSSKSAASRVSQYPEPINRFRREVHAPCRVSRFGFASSSRPSPSGSTQKEFSADLMGNSLVSRYEKAKNSAIDALRYFKKDKEVVRDDVSEDSSIEEIEVLENGREGLSVISDQRTVETNGVLAKFRELDRKVAEGDFQPSSSSVIVDLMNSNLKGDGRLINREFDVLGVPLHKKLLQSAERRNSVLSSLSFQIELKEKLRAKLQLFRPAKKPEEDVPREPFVPLSKDEETEVSRALSISHRKRVLVTHENSNIEITGEVLQCLRPGAWLNDEVINVYLELLKEREKREPKKFLKCHFFNTFFYKKLIGGGRGYDFKSVRRWTTQRKLGYFLLECEKIFVPIHKEIHWCLAVINKKEEKFQYLDSLGGIDNQVLKVLARFFVDEVKDKSGKDIDVSSWKQEFVRDLPEQGNGYDCGVFMIKYADFYSRGVGLCFNQEHMPYFRRRTAKEILRLKAE